MSPQEYTTGKLLSSGDLSNGKGAMPFTQTTNLPGIGMSSTNLNSMSLNIVQYPPQSQQQVALARKKMSGSGAGGGGGGSEQR
jgi:hypothetical protein